MTNENIKKFLLTILTLIILNIILIKINNDIYNSFLLIYTLCCFIILILTGITNIAINNSKKGN